MKTAPEKIHVLPIAAIVLKELLKRFKVDNIVISDTGVKEGYMALVATGAEEGIPVDLGAPSPLFVAGEFELKPAKKKKSGGGKAKAAQPDGANDKKSRDGKRASPRRAKNRAAIKRVPRNRAAKRLRARVRARQRRIPLRQSPTASRYGVAA